MIIPVELCPERDTAIRRVVVVVVWATKSSSHAGLVVVFVFFEVVVQADGLGEGGVIVKFASVNTCEGGIWSPASDPWSVMGIFGRVLWL